MVDGSWQMVVGSWQLAGTARGPCPFYLGKQCAVAGEGARATRVNKAGCARTDSRGRLSPRGQAWIAEGGCPHASRLGSPREAIPTRTRAQGPSTPQTDPAKRDRPAALRMTSSSAKAAKSHRESGTQITKKGK